MRWVLALGLVGCYSATPAQNVPCAENGRCPKGQTCDYSRATPTCVDELGPSDAGIDEEIDAPPDVPPDTMRAPPAGATLWLRFDDALADGAADSAGSHNGACTDCPTSVAGHLGMAGDFSDDLLTVTPPADFAPGNGFSIAAWVRVDAAPQQPFATVVARVSGSSAPTYAIFINPDRTTNFYSTPGAGLNGPAVTLGTWHHVAFTWDGDMKRGFLDGVQVATRASDTLSVANQSPLLVGNYGNQLELDGAIDELFFYPRVLSAAEILELFANH
jgi:hypothetical protein